MSERQQILYMQTRIMRLASEEWGRPIGVIAELFVKHNVLQYIEEGFGIFHVEGDEAVLNDVTSYLKNKGAAIDAGIEKAVTEETKKNAIDLLITMVVDELAEDMNLPAAELLPRFVVSKTGSLLYEESSKLWWNGPSDIAEMFKAEIAD